MYMYFVVVNLILARGGADTSAETHNMMVLKPVVVAIAF